MTCQASFRPLMEAARVAGIEPEVLGIDDDGPGSIEVEVIYNGSLDESFTILPDYAVFVANTVAESVRAEYAVDADKVHGWSVTLRADDAPLGTPYLHRIEVVEVD